MKKRKRVKGFTLIELLAIIVILAIIAVITVPIILNVIDNAKMGSIQDSAYGYKDAVNKFYVSKLSEDPTYDLTGTYTPAQLKNMGLVVSGLEPEDGWIKIEKGNVLDYSLKFDGDVANYDETTKKPSVTKGGEVEVVLLRSLEDRLYTSGEAVKNYGGFDWHVIGDDGENVTLLMDYGPNGSFKLPEDPNGDLDVATGTMKHCTNDKDTSSDCGTYSGTYSGQPYTVVQYKWTKSLIHKYLDETFYEYFKNEISNNIVQQYVCGEQSLNTRPSNTPFTYYLYSYGGSLASELIVLGEIGYIRGCNGQWSASLNGYSPNTYVRLITMTEYYNLAPATTKSSGVTHGITSKYIGPTDTGTEGVVPNMEHITAISEAEALEWLYSDEIGEWWTTGAHADGSVPDASSNAKYISSDGSFLGGYASSNKAIRPVITVQK